MEGRADDARIGQASPQGSDFAPPQRPRGSSARVKGAISEGVVAELRGEVALLGERHFADHFAAERQLHLGPSFLFRGTRSAPRRAPAEAGLHPLFIPPIPRGAS